MLEGEYRRTLQELKAKYCLEPSLCDIYLEGDTDKAVISWFVNAAGYSDIGVHKIDAIDVPKAFVESLGLPNNNRSRVIAVSLFLVEIEATRSFCVVDLDFDGVLGIQINNSALIYTEFSSLEMYLYSEKMLSKFFQLYLRQPSGVAKVWLASLASMLKEIFAIRLTLHTQKYVVGLPDIWNCCTWSAADVVFDSGVFIGRVAMKIGGGVSRERLMSEIAVERAKLVGEDRICIRGHDFVEALRWTVMKVYKKKLADETSFARTLFAMLELEYCRTFSLFKEVERRLAVG